MKLHHQAQRGAQHGTWLCLPPSTELRGPHSADDFREHLHGRESSHTVLIGTQVLISTGESSVYALSLRQFHCSGTDI